MKTKSNRGWLFAAGLLLSMSPMSVWAVMLSLEPVETIAGPGDTVSLNLVIGGLGDLSSDSLGDFDIDIGFDATALSFVGYDLGSFLGDVSLFEAVDYSYGLVADGIINLAEVSLLEADATSCIFCIAPYLDDIQPDQFVLATLDFQVETLPPGTDTIVSIDNVYALGDGFGAPLLVDSTADAVISNPAAVSVSEPSTLALMGLGMASISFRRRKKPLGD